MARSWTPSSWQAFPAEQQPDWPDDGALDRALKQIARFPPLVFAGEARTLQASLGQGRGRQRLLAAGRRLRGELRGVLGGQHPREAARHPADGRRARPTRLGVPVVKVGRIAGQFAKPRSAPTETRRRRRPASVPRPHRQRRGANSRGADPRPRAPRAGLPPDARRR